MKFARGLLVLSLAGLFAWCAGPEVSHGETAFENNPFFQLYKREILQEVENVLKNGADVNARDEYGAEKEKVVVNPNPQVGIEKSLPT